MAAQPAEPSAFVVTPAMLELARLQDEKARHEAEAERHRTERAKYEADKSQHDEQAERHRAGAARANADATIEGARIQARATERAAVIGFCGAVLAALILVLLPRALDGPGPPARPVLQDVPAVVTRTTGELAPRIGPVACHGPHPR